MYSIQMAIRIMATVMCYFFLMHSKISLIKMYICFDSCKFPCNCALFSFLTDFPKKELYSSIVYIFFNVCSPIFFQIMKQEKKFFLLKKSHLHDGPVLKIFIIHTW